MCNNYNNQSVNGIIFSKNRKEILLIKRRDVPVWVLPGGGIDTGETPGSAVIRELCEETGYKVNIIRKIAEYTPLNKMARYTHFYECGIISGQPEISSETQGVSFFSISDLPLMPPPYSEWIADACQNKDTIIKKDIKSVNYFNFIKLLIRHPVLVMRFVLARFGYPIND